MPPAMTRRRGPNLSTSHPSNGTSQVSSSTNTVNVTCTAACSAWSAFCSGGTNRVQPYWKFATATMLRTLKNRISQRLESRLSPVARPGSDVCAMAATPIYGIGRLCRRPVLLELFAEWNHPGDEPVIPHLIHLRLEVRDVVFGEVGETALPVEVVAHRNALEASVRDVAGLPDQAQDALLHFVEWPYAGEHRQLAQLVRLHRVVIPALRAWIERVDEGRPTDGQRLAHRVHRQHGIGHVDGGDVAALGVPRGHHARHVLLPAVMHDALLA